MHIHFANGNRLTDDEEYKAHEEGSCETETCKYCEDPELPAPWLRVNGLSVGLPQEVLDSLEEKDD